uniref:Uncharacterized protein n=1 Tax=uncultured marine virus TaxID=186617 RepID=A0A0F7L990_9VIRU|nr:hypothetical protein [uncultured marine virus]
MIEHDHSAIETGMVIVDLEFVLSFDINAHVPPDPMDDGVAAIAGATCITSLLGIVDEQFVDPGIGLMIEHEFLKKPTWCCRYHNFFLFECWG